MIDLSKFYAQVSRYLMEKFGYDQNYNESYGVQRQKDAYYAVKIIGFEIIPVGNRVCSIQGDYAPVPYTHIYNREDTKPDLQYLIAPDTRVPSYTTSLDDCIELANKIGMKTLEIPKQRLNVCEDFINQILSACDKVICES